MRLFNQFLRRNVSQRAVQRLVDACKRVKQNIVRDHEAALRSLGLLNRENPFKMFKPFNHCAPFKTLKARRRFQMFQPKLKRPSRSIAARSPEQGRRVQIVATHESVPVVPGVPWHRCERNDFFVSSFKIGRWASTEPSPFPQAGEGKKRLGQIRCSLHRKTLSPFRYQRLSVRAISLSMGARKLMNHFAMKESKRH